MGTDLLDGTPEPLRAAIVDGDEHPSEPYDALDAAGAGPSERWSVTETSAGHLTWGYVLRPEGIEVIHLEAFARGPIVTWETDPQARFGGDWRWHLGHPPPTTLPPRATPVMPASAPATRARPVARR
ncbi:hypothetical protein AQI95_35895 [Streptomyces yokosukanensis]|uniref:Uncharacterized protein n=1 Tax=Streptomyces yokosukanensis TaxID=67386 RepID=A0A101NVN0_9ACTN|nr:hypothetical protein [Streptomyces yokosukanensis]KUM99902.1 hypothetical protein AQI95_35895 [Streptomyces yokosukanensis]